ncbi:MAG: hypothetical protein ACR2L2_04310 [Acidobacteriota bacterium]
MRNFSFGLRWGLAAITLAVILAQAGVYPGDHKYKTWTLEEALQVLTRSPWAKQHTYTRVVGGIGSGVLGEKEIYSTFFVRILSARPVREAFARVNQIQHGYDQMAAGEKRELDALTFPGVEMDVSRWIILTVSFRSSDRNEELRVKQFFDVQTTETIRNRTFLSTSRLGQVQLAAYYPPREDELGAKFVFPRELEGVPVISSGDSSFAFELALPGFDPELRTTFTISEMLVDGQPLL